MPERIPEVEVTYLNGMCFSDPHLRSLRNGLTLLLNAHEGAHMLQDMLGLPLGVEHDRILDNIEAQEEAFRRALTGTLN